MLMKAVSQSITDHLRRRRNAERGAQRQQEAGHRRRTNQTCACASYYVDPPCASATMDFLVATCACADVRRSG